MGFQSFDPIAAGALCDDVVLRDLSRDPRVLLLLEISPGFLELPTVDIT